LLLYNIQLSNQKSNMASSPAKKAIDANRGKVAPFVTNQVSLHDHQPQKIDGKTYNFSLAQIPNLNCHVATMTIPSQVSVLSTFFALSLNYYLFKMQAGRYSCKNLTLEMDLTNTTTLAVQLVPALMLVDYIRITTGSGAILQTLYGEELWGYLSMSSNNKRMTGYQNITNTAPTTFQSAGTIAASALVTYNIPLSLSFLVQLDFFLGNLNDLALTIQVYSRGPGVYITGAVGDITLNTSWLRLDAEYHLSVASDAKLAEQKSKPHQWKFLNTAHQTQSVAMTAGNVYPIQLVSLNGLVPFAWFILRQSTTGAGLTTGTLLTNFEWRDSHNTSLQNGVLMRNAIAHFEYGTREFDSVFFQNNYAYPTCWVPRPLELIKHPANTGFQYLENSFLCITAAVTATVTLDVYLVRWAILQLTPDGQLSVDN